MMSRVALTRRVTFSSGHRYWLNSLTPEENRGLFGHWASPYNHGHNYVLYVTVEGELVAENGMVVNIKTIDGLIRERVLAQFEQKSINDEVAEFCDRPATLENLLIYIADEIGDLPGSTRLSRLELRETETLYGTYEPEKKHLTITRSYEFAASHRLHAEALTPQQNEELFGKCNNPHGHGHNYVLEVTVAGAPDTETGMLCRLEQLDEAVETRVVDRYDHRNLNEDVEELRGKNPTSEVVAIEIFKQLQGHLPAELERVRLFETARNLFEVKKGDV